MKTVSFFVVLFSWFAPLYAQTVDSVWLNAVNTRASAAVDAGDIRSCMAIFSGALDTARRRYGAENEVSIYLLESLGDVQKMAGDYKAAEQSLNTLLDICKKQYGNRHERVAKALGQLGFTCFNLGKNDTVEHLLTESKQMFEDLGMHFSHQLASVNSNLAAYYQSRGFYLKAEQLHLESVEIEKNMPVFDESIYSAAINNLAVFYSIMQRADKALPYLDISLKIKEKQLGKTHPFYLITLKNKGRILTDAGRYGEAEIILIEALETARTTFAPGDAKLSGYLKGVAMFYEKIGKYDEALRLEEESLSLIANQYGNLNPGYINGLLSQATLHRECNRLEQADTLLRQALQILDQQHRSESDQYASALTQLGEICQQRQRPDLARPLLEKGAHLGGKIIGTDHPAFHALYGEALVRQNLLENRPDSALRILDGVRNPILTAYGERHERFIKMETQYGAAWQLKGDAGQSLEHFKIAFTALQGNLAENFSFLSLDEREKFARSFEGYHAAFLAAARAFSGDENIRAFLYDLTLFQKELLASYDRQLLAGWQQNADSMYHAYVEVRRMIARQWTLPAPERHDLPELENRRTALEKALAGQSNTTNTAAVFRPVRWQQIQQALQPGDAAVEWLRLPPAREGLGAPCYAALVLRPGGRAPELVLLPEVAGTDALFASKGVRGLQYATRTYSGEALYGALWQPLEARLAGVKRIFYAPTGALHLLNFDAITMPGGRLLAEKYRLVRVTNTARLREAGFGQMLPNTGAALLAGGLNYESAAPSDAPKEENLVSRGASWRGGDSNPVREWAALPNTLPEVEHLAALMQEKKRQTTLLTGSNGSETAVKTHCTGATPPGILHFATHGFFFEKNTAAPGSLGLVAAENPMFRSGLILAGANPAWRGQPAGNGPDDGILTADEISLLPLRNTALVVLSACETGLGDVHDDEGVYGLQRAFRLAGASTIVMSLWRVPDVQTREFMEKFYAGLLENGDTRGAFQSARQAMQKQYGNPYYWAGFILLE